MVKILPILEDIEDVINRVNIFKKIYIGKPKGVERSGNTPFAMIILEQINHQGAMINLIIQIVIVFDIKNDTKKLYDEFLEADYIIKEELLKLPYKVEIEDTFLDEDRLETLKAGVIRFKISDLIEFK